MGLLDALFGPGGPTDIDKMQTKNIEDVIAKMNALTTVVGAMRNGNDPTMMNNVVAKATPIVVNSAMAPVVQGAIPSVVNGAMNKVITEASSKATSVVVVAANQQVIDKAMPVVVRDALGKVTTQATASVISGAMPKVVSDATTKATSSVIAGATQAVVANATTLVKNGVLSNPSFLSQITNSVKTEIVKLLPSWLDSIVISESPRRTAKTILVDLAGFSPAAWKQTILAEASSSLTTWLQGIAVAPGVSVWTVIQRMKDFDPANIVTTIRSTVLSLNFGGDWTLGNIINRVYEILQLGGSSMGSWSLNAFFVKIAMKSGLEKTWNTIIGKLTSLAEPWLNIKTGFNTIKAGFDSFSSVTVHTPPGFDNIDVRIPTEAGLTKMVNGATAVATGFKNVYDAWVKVTTQTTNFWTDIFSTGFLSGFKALLPEHALDDPKPGTRYGSEANYKPTLPLTPADRWYASPSEYTGPAAALPDDSNPKPGKNVGGV